MHVESSKTKLTSQLLALSNAWVKENSGFSQGSCHKSLHKCKKETK